MSCFSFTATRDWCYRSIFTKSGLRSTITDLGDGTVIHCWVPKTRKESKPNLLLIHGFGANALWQWGDLIPYLVPTSTSTSQISSSSGTPTPLDPSGPSRSRPSA
ncbi:hypothetical protein CK203_022126 [Vitis vinifera]|uniref:Uncharacterized protein n=1 Tax=Vitis vinifera TaxID=29760 RepID=A0A438FZK2_VITVI|nr:hypothetical protein CK203_022126 [Vitis vinifera]